MTKDKRIVGVLESARQKRADGSGMNVKEWSVLAGYGYDQGRAMTHMEGFPIFKGRIVWDDWNKYRQVMLKLAGVPSSQSDGVPRSAHANKFGERVYRHD